MKKVVQFLIVALVTLGLLVWAHFAAKSAFEQSTSTVVKDLNFYRVFYSIASTIILLIPAYWLFIFQRRQGPSVVWRNFWTFAFVTFLVHLYWAIFGMMGGDVERVFHDKDLVSAPIPDTIVTIWWAVDVALAWLISGRPKWVQIQRGALHVALFIGFVVAAIPQGEGLVRVLGVLLVITALVASVLRVIILPFDARTLIGNLYILIFKFINLFFPWHVLPTWLGILNLGAYRETLRAKNLQGTNEIPATNSGNVTAIPAYDPLFLLKRHDDGDYNDLKCPAMGGASTNSNTVAPGGSSAQATHDSMYFNSSQPGARFGRNVPLDEAHADEENLLIPNPRLISNELLARDTFKPATILNLLAAAWIQFETHDWFNHGEPPWEGEKKDKEDRGLKDSITSEQYEPHKVTLPDGDRWFECPMRIRPTRPDPTRDYSQEPRDAKGRLKYPKTYANAESHWWDGSQIYGSNPETTHRLRSAYKKDESGHLLRDEQGHLIPTGELLVDGKLFIGKDGLSLDPSTGTALSGFTGNWWVGLSLLHTLFTREHNAICDAIRREYPYWSGDEVFQVARLVNSALIAKIHTIEWTPAILTHPALQVGMAANWWGLLTEDVKKMFGRISENEAFSGIPGSGVDHGPADYSLTEEFVSVYRLHPLLPDKLEIRSALDGHKVKEYTLPDGIIGDESVLHVLSDVHSMADIFYSFGVANPGAVTLHNYPKFLRELKRPKQFGVEEIIDLAAIDILRDRERGVPRYNRFRRLLHCKPIASFDDFKNPDFPTLGEDLRRVYGTTGGRDNVEMLDLMVGMFAEVPPEGFGFSDTAFRVFILMASRRLKSDRFIAGDAFIPDVYTKVGLDWLENTTMRDILVRHYPELKASLYGVTNAFAPWKRVETNPGVATLTQSV